MSRQGLLSLGIFFLIIGGILIGFGFGLNALIPALVESHEASTDEINSILATWRSRHPDDIYAQTWAVTSPEVYQRALDLRNYLWGIMFLGVICCVGGAFAVYRGSIIESKEKLEEKVFCRYCGAGNKKDASFCQKCGKKISEGE